MAVALLDLTAALLATAVVLLAPGTALLGAVGARRVIPMLLLPAAAIGGTILVAAIALIATLALHGSRLQLGLGLTALSLVLAFIWLRRSRGNQNATMRRAFGERLIPALPFLPPALLLFVLGLFDAPQVRSDTFWHVALARKIAELDQLSSAALSFEAGAPGNANYPLPVYHALIALADAAPRVDLWSATWFMTLWLAPVAMLAFAGMVAELVGDRRATLVGAWTFVAIVVLGYGPWFFATRYLSYAGQAAILLVLPVVVTSIVLASTACGRARQAQLAVAAAGTIAIGLLHGNYVLYPALFAGGMAVLLLLGRRAVWRGAGLTACVVVAAGMLVLGAQLPWITNDDNFLRGTGDPSGEPTAFMRHRDVFVGTEASHHVELGSLATQPGLVLGALAIPFLLLLRRRRSGPWALAGGALAIAAFARSPDAIELIDALGSVTPATRLDRVYPAAVGVAAAAIGVGWLLERTWRRSAVTGIVMTTIALAAIGAASWWLDSIRDTRRIVVTAFVEARWVGGLDPSGLPRMAVFAATLLTIAAAIVIRMRVRMRNVEPALDVAKARGDQVRRLAALAMVAVTVGLAPATIERAVRTWQPQAYDRSTRSDARFERIEVYPAGARAAIATIEPRSIVLAGINDTRRIASLAPVRSVEESALRKIVDVPPTTANAASVLDALIDAWKPDYLAASSFDRSFKPLLDAAAADPCRFESIASGPLRIYRLRGDDSCI